MRYRVSSQARKDLAEIWLFIAQDDLDSADNFIELLVSRFPMLAKSPQMGRGRNELSDGVRSFPVDRYLIFYRLDAKGIEIVRVIHSGRDIDSLLSD